MTAWRVGGPERRGLELLGVDRRAQVGERLLQPGDVLVGHVEAQVRVTGVRRSVVHLELRDRPCGRGWSRPSRCGGGDGVEVTGNGEVVLLLERADGGPAGGAERLLPSGLAGSTGTSSAPTRASPEHCPLDRPTCVFDARRARSARSSRSTTSVAERPRGPAPRRTRRTRPSSSRRAGGFLASAGSTARRPGPQLLLDPGGARLAVGVVPVIELGVHRVTVAA